MTISVEMIVNLLRTLLEWLLRLVHESRDRRSKWERERLGAYSSFVSVMDRAHVAASECIDLRTGLHWWNGARRLQLMRATGLDKRLLDVGNEVCTSMELVRTIGTPAAVRDAEALLDAVATPLLRFEQGERGIETDLHAFTQRRHAFLESIRSEFGVEPILST